MTIVSITSDWKYADYYLGALKGALYSLPYSIRVVDIANSVPNFDVLQEIFVLKSSFYRFPKFSIHLMAVKSEPAPNKPMVIAFCQGHYFIGINDGRFSLLFDSLPTICFEIKMTEEVTNTTFKALDLFVEGVSIILENRFESSTVASQLVKEYAAGVVYDQDSITGRVINCDSFGNAITNISRSLFDKLHQGRDFTIFVQGPYLKIRSISVGYHSAEVGERVALFNSLGLLELAIIEGDFSQVEGVATSTQVKIKFGTI